MIGWFKKKQKDKSDGADDTAQQRPTSDTPSGFVPQRTPTQERAEAVAHSRMGRPEHARQRASLSQSSEIQYQAGNGRFFGSCCQESLLQNQRARRCSTCGFPLMKVAGKYRLNRILSQGGGGLLYEAEHVYLSEKKKRAIKVIRPELSVVQAMQERFWREVEVTARLSLENEHIVRVYDDFGEEEHLGYYYIMEFLEGEILSQLFKNGRLPAEEPALALDLFLQLCDAMQATHRAGIVHRDLKPPNLFLLPTDDGYFVKVCDFGIAKDLSFDDGSMTQSMIGTPAYMSPEQVNNGSIDHRTDIYSMAAVLYECLVGQPPLGKPSSSQDLFFYTRIIDEQPRLISECKPEWPWLKVFDPILAKALAKKPQERYQDVAAFKQAVVKARDALVSSASSANPSALVGRLCKGSYLLEEKIFTGHNATTYKGFHQGLQVPVAVKCLHMGSAGSSEKERKRFQQEARVQFRLKHRNIVQAIDFFEEDGIPTIVLEWIQGVSLKELLSQKGGAVSLATIWRLMEPILGAVEFAHQQRVVHRGLEPSSILLQETEHGYVPKISNFGLVKILDEETGLTTARPGMGVDLYVSPEQCMEDGIVERFSDIYSLGVILYELATGDTPFRGNDYMLRMQHVEKEPPAPRSKKPDLPKDVEKVILRCLQKAPGHRYRSCLELSEALKSAIFSSTVPLKDSGSWGLSERQPSAPSFPGMEQVSWDDDEEEETLAVQMQQAQSSKDLTKTVFEGGAELKQLTDFLRQEKASGKTGSSPSLGPKNEKPAELFQTIAVPTFSPEGPSSQQKRTEDALVPHNLQAREPGFKNTGDAIKPFADPLAPQDGVGQGTSPKEFAKTALSLPISEIMASFEKRGGLPPDGQIPPDMNLWDEDDDDPGPTQQNILPKAYRDNHLPTSKEQGISRDALSAHPGGYNFSEDDYEDESTERSEGTAQVEQLHTFDLMEKSKGGGSLAADELFGHDGNLKSSEQLRYQKEREAYLQQRKNDAHRSYLNGRNLEQSGAFLEAEKSYREALSYDSENIACWNALGSLLHGRLGKFKEAEVAYRRTIELGANHAVPWFNLGLVLLQLRRYEEAEHAYREAIKLDPNHLYSWNGLGNLLQAHLKRYQEAKVAYQRASELDPQNVVPLYNLAVLLHQHLREYQEAYHAYRKALEFDPDDASIWYSLGDLLYLDMKRPEEAKDIFRQAVALQPDGARGKPYIHQLLTA